MSTYNWTISPLQVRLVVNVNNSRKKILQEKQARKKCEQFNLPINPF